MNTPYTCYCGHSIESGGLPALILHEVVSHRGKTPIEEVTR